MEKIAVLIPCYNESKTIGKVVRDYSTALPTATFMFMIITPLTGQTLSLVKPELLYDTKNGKARAM